MTNNKYYQKCITFGRAYEGLRADFQKQLIEMQKEIGFEYVRFHGIFHDDMAVYKEVNSLLQTVIMCLKAKKRKIIKAL